MISVLVYVTDRGPIFYSQMRTGYLGKEIKIFKIRSMEINAEKNDPVWAAENDSRITKIGKFIRKTRLDELPQLISVIRGEMSLIGPRPERPLIEKDLLNNIPNYDLRHLFKPGLSGWAQVNFPYGASIEDSYIKLSFDLYYIAKFSIFHTKQIQVSFDASCSVAMSDIGGTLVAARVACRRGPPLRTKASARRPAQRPCPASPCPSGRRARRSRRAWPEWERCLFLTPVCPL